MILIANIILTILYVIFAIKYKKDVPESFSETSSFWPNAKLNMFTCFCVIIGVLLFYPWITAGSYEYLAFLGIGGLIAAGTTPLFKKDMFQRKLHYIGGVISETASLLWMFLNGYWIWLLVIAGLIIIGVIIKRKSWVFISEFVTMITLYLILILRCF